jgi:hypothetical protein
MANIAPSKTENDFTFVVGDDSYQCPWFVADFLSPRIGHLHSLDPTINEFVIETEDPEHQFASLLSLGRGESLAVPEPNLPFLASVASELGNCELYFSVHNVQQKAVTVSTFCEHFKDCDFVDNFSKEAIEFLAAHFFEFEQSFLTGLPIELLTQILGDESLTIESEDSLFEFVLSRLELNPSSATVLLEFVRFEFLTKSAIDKFVLWSFDHFHEMEITLSLWKAIAKRLSAQGNPSFPITSRYRNLFSLREGSPLDGIIAELTRAYGGNVHEREIVNVTASAVYSTNVAQNAADLAEQNYFHSPDQANQWLCYDFKDRRVDLTDYSIAAHTNNHFLRSWVVEGSDDGSAWTVLDERKGNADANSNHPIATFPVTNRKMCRQVRLRQTANSAYNAQYLVLYGFEVFGLLTGPVR